MHTMYFDLIYPDSSQIHPTMSLSPPTFMSFYFFTDSLSTVCTAYILTNVKLSIGAWSTHQVPHPQRKQLSTAHCFFGLGAHESLRPPSWNVDQLDLVQAAIANVSSDMQWACCVQKTLL